jgi:hypothetical protein
MGRVVNLHQCTVGRILKMADPTIDTRRVGGEKHGSWKGGRVKVGGYNAIWLPMDHKFASMRNRMGYVLEHRLVVAEKLNRSLTKKETVHHIDGNIANNDPNNLQLRQGKHGMNAAYRCRTCGSIDVEPIDL